MKPTIFITTHSFSVLVYQKLNPIEIQINHKKPKKSTKIAVTPPMTFYGKIY